MYPQSLRDATDVGLQDLLHLVGARQCVLGAWSARCARLRFACWADAFRPCVKLKASPPPTITTAKPTCALW